MDNDEGSRDQHSNELSFPEARGAFFQVTAPFPVLMIFFCVPRQIFFFTIYPPPMHDRWCDVQF